MTLSVLHEILAERIRQIAKEGYDARHDDDHDDGQLCLAALSYCNSAGTCLLDTSMLPPHPSWPWEHRYWKPKTPRRDLIRAAALIVAEIERLDRFTS